MASIGVLTEFYRVLYWGLFGVVVQASGYDICDSCFRDMGFRTLEPWGFQGFGVLDLEGCRVSGLLGSSGFG